MEARDALDRISYMDELIRESRGNLSRSWWVLLVWGFSFCLIGLWSLSVVDKPPVFPVSYLGFVTGYVLIFSGLIGLPILFSILLARPSTELTKRLLLLNALLVAMFLAVSLFAHKQATILPLSSGGRLRIDWDFLPLMAGGTLLIATGIFLSRSLAKVGFLLVILGGLTTVPDLHQTWTENGPGPFTRGSVPGILYLVSGLILIVYAIWVRSHRDS